MSGGLVERTYGASFRRDLDCWIIYEGMGEKELCRCSYEDVDHVLSALRSAATITALQAEVERLREALEPSGDTKAAYHGEFFFNMTRTDECGDEYQERVYVPWTSVKEIMAAISARAALEPKGTDDA